MERMRPMFSFFGSKWRLAPRYPAPLHDLIIEPFAGAASYALCYPERDVRLVDADPKIAETWRYLIGTTPDRIRALPLYNGDWTNVDELSIAQGAKYLIGWWLNKGGASPGKSPSAWMRDPTYNSDQFWSAKIRERIATQQPRIAHWTIYQTDYLDTPNKYATWFIDPPYQVAGKYRYRPTSYDVLAKWCKDRLGQTIVCENVGATWLPFEPFANVKGTDGAYRSGVSKEAIWIGGR